MNELIDIQVDFGGEGDVVNKDYDIAFTHADWTLTIVFDLEADELIFNTVLGPNRWLALGLSNNLLNADVI